MDYQNIIERKLDLFFDKEGKDYLNMDIYSQIFDFMEESGLRENEPILFEAELKRIRDLHNSFATAFEDGEIKGKTNLAKTQLREGLPVDLIVKLTGLTKEEIERLK